ncbi:hypothetical protein [Aeromonas hydrophila]|uniref:hypothetical protein n=1 Tax=Aeromonas hydrophila TaxID=644 RepID=UPI0012D377E2|nr:hypothetical protein [Aeromonas hydrophila]
MKHQTKEIKELVEIHEAGSIRDREFITRLFTLTGEMRAKYSKDNATLANPSRMGVARKSQRPISLM